MTRKATVMANSMGPEIRFRGQWLGSWGFHPGQTLVVSQPAAGQMLLTVNSPAALTGDELSNVIAVFDSQRKAAA